MCLAPNRANTLGNSNPAFDFFRNVCVGVFRAHPSRHRDDRVLFGWEPSATDDEIAAVLASIRVERPSRRRAPATMPVSSELPATLAQQVQAARVLRGVLDFLRARSRVVNCDGRLLRPAVINQEAELLDVASASTCLKRLTMNSDLKLATKMGDVFEVKDDSGRPYPFHLSFLIREVSIESSCLLVPGLSVVDVPGTMDANLARGGRVAEVLGTANYAVQLTNKTTR